MSNTEELPPSPSPQRGDFETDNEWHRAVDAWYDAEKARTIAAGQAVYDRIKAAAERAEGSQIGDRVRITPANFRDFMSWFEAYGGARFGLSTSMEFKMFSGSVLVVVR